MYACVHRESYRQQFSHYWIGCSSRCVRSLCAREAPASRDRGTRRPGNDAARVSSGGRGAGRFLQPRADYDRRDVHSLGRTAPHRRAGGNIRMGDPADAAQASPGDRGDRGWHDGRLRFHEQHTCRGGDDTDHSAFGACSWNFGNTFTDTPILTCPFSAAR